MEGILNDLTKLDLAGDRPILGDVKNVQEAVRQARADLKDDSAKEVIEISSGSEGSNDALPTNKAYRLAKLTTRASEASNNAALGSLVKEFAEAMKCNSSRTLTRQGFAFLDALYKQLADPSVFVTPLRYVYFTGAYLKGCFDVVIPELQNNYRT